MEFFEIYEFIKDRKMDFKTYAKSRQSEICLELERVKLLLEKAGNPHRGMYIIHVAGTHG